MVVAEGVLDHVDQRAVGAVAQAEGGGHRGGHALAAHRHQVDEPGAAGMAGGGAGAGLHRQAGLAHAAGPHEVHQPRGGECVGHGVEFGAAADEAGQRGRCAAEGAGPVAVAVARRRAGRQAGQGGHAAELRSGPGAVTRPVAGQAAGVAGELPPVGDAQLAEQGRHVTLDRPDRDVEALADLRVGEVVRDAQEHLRLAL